MENNRIAVALSGGVDSSMTARLLLAGGYDVHAVTFLMHRAEKSPAEGAAEVCRALGIPHSTVDASEEFARTVIADFRNEYACGRTPNPCVVCNRYIKFPYLLRFAQEQGCAHAATGHYVRLVRCGSRISVAKAADSTKDQSYMLWRLPQQTLQQLIFPLGTYTKTEIRALAAEAGIPSAATKDSQDICFIADGDYARFLAELSGPLPPGSFVDEAGNDLGPAKNQACYTVGQRRGLGIALGRHMYVVARDAAANRVCISPQDPYAKTVRADRINYMAAAPGDLDAPQRLTVKLRYARAEFPCTAQADGDRLTVTLDESARAPSAGQSLVLYDGDTVVAGGIITEWERGGT